MSSSSTSAPSASFAAAARRRTPPPTLTEAQREAQARGKAWESVQEVREAESFLERKRREEAVEVLESVEALMWFAASWNQSLAATRQHFQNVALGLAPQAPVAWREEGEMPHEQRVHHTTSGAASPAGGRARGNARGKKRE
ncbi:uncharacterized protein EI97DRAFT_438811 [Westerdykella ornata]|uniref:Uncharacterized protein n=1 Tax=Westerdykella ornata TaxID=318751 RepID=A0A6A6K097_WESOR|nr:uncharacterized protein EI97DRAFT_438811 [Westerdykella ornata]KAF2281466.1 hypothetical protein EI97DRAFT_438811 [Westerdykella ornata]